MGIQEHSPNIRFEKEKKRIGKENCQQGEEKTMAAGRREEGMEKKTQTVFFFFFKKNSKWINEGHFLCKIINIFSDGSLNHGYAILSDVIKNIYKLVA